MKAKIQERDGAMQVQLISESVEEIVQIIELSNRVKGSVKTFGAIGTTTWLWIEIPVNKNISNYDAVKIGNIYK